MATHLPSLGDKLGLLDYMDSNAGTCSRSVILRSYFRTSAALRTQMMPMYGDISDSKTLLILIKNGRIHSA